MSSFSISNTIFLKDTEINNSDGIDAVKHEWGHTVQQNIMGTPKYLVKVALPSMLGYKFGPFAANYYSQPWERNADYFGNTHRNPGTNGFSGYSSNSDFWSTYYFMMY